MSTLLQYACTAAVWGASFLFIKVAVSGLSPAQVVLGRLVGGAMLLALLMLVTGRKWPRGTVWLHFFAMAFIMCVAPFLLFSWAAQSLPSGLSSIFNATTPIATLLLALAVLPDERLTRAKTIALFAAAGGIILVLAPWQLWGAAASTSVLPQLACLMGSVMYGVGFIYSRRFFRAHEYDSSTVAASQISSAAVIMLVLAPFLARDAVTLSPPVVVSMLLLGTIGTGIAYVWYNNVMNALGATLASTVTYLTPLVAVVLGITVLGERLAWYEVAGGLVVIIAVLVAQSGTLRGFFRR
ncbi:drug/metabolite transporter (DMT)-like permease [Arthrobacter sp. 1088]|uniref:DMT family transporter n=1 Tax=Arthrobacter sp. 1088 TaxID=2817768 RepID=UPI002866BFB9|nr:DMT family transporter [Arthrobacter sp. 1088]MDR6688642.1 drug/metabolite transporter (DMT)-like permease [Arthrobacter sp. 1088]